jgi:predicted amidophosphoribosyltransferase
MALINCPECKKEISDKAEACPNCGYPINNVKSDDLLCPEFPNDLSIV